MLVNHMQRLKNNEGVTKATYDFTSKHWRRYRVDLLGG